MSHLAEAKRLMASNASQTAVQVASVHALIAIAEHLEVVAEQLREIPKM